MPSKIIINNIKINCVLLQNREICSGDKVAEWLQPCFPYFASLYLDIINKQRGETRKEFFGLRDFYRLETDNNVCL